MAGLGCQHAFDEIFGASDVPRLERSICLVDERRDLFGPRVVRWDRVVVTGERVADIGIRTEKIPQTC